MLRWVPCLGSPSPVKPGMWSALRTPGSRLMNCWATRTSPAAHREPVNTTSPFSLRIRLLGWDHPNVQLLELPLFDRTRRAEHEVLVALRLRERDDVAHVLGADDRHHQPVDARGDATVRRHAVLECVEQMPELGPDPLPVHAQDLEDAFLQLAVMDTHAAAGDLDAVEDAVVRARPDVVRPLVEKAHVLRPRRRERMMAVGELSEVVFLEEIHRVDPQELPFAVADELAPPRDLLAQESHHRLRLSPPVGDQQDDVVGGSARRGLDRGHLAFAQVTVERARNPGEALRARALRHQRKLVELTTAQV